MSVAMLSCACASTGAVPYAFPTPAHSDTTATAPLVTDDSEPAAEPALAAAPAPEVPRNVIAELIDTALEQIGRAHV